jgi:hypothetical protein
MGMVWFCGGGVILTGFIYPSVPSFFGHCSTLPELQNVLVDCLFAQVVAGRGGPINSNKSGARGAYNSELESTTL